MLTVSSSTLRTALAALLATTAGAFAFTNVSVVTTSIDTSPIIVTGSGSEATSAGDTGLLMPEPPQPLTETTARPVFFADRKPIAAKQASAPQQEIQDPSAASLQLLGTVRLGKGKVKALIRTADAQSGKWVPIGDKIEGWQVREVSGDRAVIESGGKRVVLKMAFASSAPASTEPPQALPPGPPPGAPPGMPPPPGQ